MATNPQEVVDARFGVAHPLAVDAVAQEGSLTACADCGVLSTMVEAEQRPVLCSKCREARVDTLRVAEQRGFRVGL